MPQVRVNDTAPDFEATTDQGELVKLSAYRGQRVVLYFYPKDDTSGCTTQACELRDSYPAIQEQNAIVLGVSPDSVAENVTVAAAASTSATASWGRVKNSST